MPSSAPKGLVSRLPAALLWLEAVVLGGMALARPGEMGWALPGAGLCALFASLLAGGLGFGWVAALVSAGGFVWLWPQVSQAGAPPGTAEAVGVVLGGVLLAFLRVLDGLGRATGVRECAGRLITALHFVVAGVLLGGAYLGKAWQPWLGAALALLCVALALDCVAKLAGRLYTPRRHHFALPAPGAFFFYRWLGEGWRSCLPVARAEDDEFSLRLAEMWMWPLLRRALPLLVVGTLLLAWLGTCLHEVPAGAQGVRQSLGRWADEPEPPGLHMSAPWPFGRMDVVETGRLREVVLGFQSDPGQPILWERAHYVEEQQSMVGGGDDLLSISVPVQYRIARPVVYLKASADAEATLRRMAERVLLRLTLGRPAREIMTTAREELRRAFHRDLQTELDAAGTGLELAEVYLRDIHPPVSVAPSFQEVVAALEEKEAFLHEGESYARDNLARGRGGAAAVRVTAQGSAANRLLSAQGQAARFASQQQAWAAARELYTLREVFRVLDENLAGAKKAIFDETMRDSLPAHLDLRKVLNPDLVDTAPPQPQTLVPRPAVSRDAFDLDIEGFLRMDQGEIPAVNLMPGDADNLLQATPPPPAPPAAVPAGP